MRVVMHIDMDAFFAAVEERYNPPLRGKPIVVGADPKGGAGRGVVSTASYAARKYGIRSALPISKAWQFSEDARRRGQDPAIFLSGNFQLYSEVSERIMKLLQAKAGLFEQASVDEAYLELKSENPGTKSETDVWRDAKRRAREIKEAIFDQEGLTVSVGVGPNKLVAKIASDFQKPDGLTMVPPEHVIEFLAPLSVRAIPGIGPKAEIELNQHGIKTIGDLQKLEPAWLIEMFGKWGEDMYRKARGISESPVSNEWEAKSMGEQETFERDVREPGPLLESIRNLSGDVFQRFEHEGFKTFRTVVITVRFADFTTLTRSKTAPRPLKTLPELEGYALGLVLPFLDRRENPRNQAFRLLGVRVEKLAR